MSQVEQAEPQYGFRVMTPDDVMKTLDFLKMDQVTRESVLIALKMAYESGYMAGGDRMLESLKEI